VRAGHISDNKWDGRRANPAMRIIAIGQNVFMRVRFMETALDRFARRVGRTRQPAVNNFFMRGKKREPQRERERERERCYRRWLIFGGPTRQSEIRMPVRGMRDKTTARDGRRVPGTEADTESYFLSLSVPRSDVLTLLPSRLPTHPPPSRLRHPFSFHGRSRGRIEPDQPSNGTS